MNKTTAILAALALGLMGCSYSPPRVSQDKSYAAQAQPLPRNNMALVYFYYHVMPEGHELIGGGYKWGLSLVSWRSPSINIAVLEGGQDGKEIGAIHNNEYFWVYLQPGIHNFTGMFVDHSGNGITTEVNLTAGQTYYFLITQSPAVYAQDIRLEQQSTAEAISNIQAYQFCNNLICDVPAYGVYDTYSGQYAAHAIAEKKAQINGEKKEQQELHCTATELRTGTCQ
ncbi:MAG: hypothetical protein ACYDCJ_09105 [Gammaproteobacteria bacterium]